MADIKKIKLLDNTEYNLVDASATHIQTVTLAQWNALTPQQQASGDYVISDATLSPLSASLIPYDNTTSGLTADDVQEAIDEISASSDMVQQVEFAGSGYDYYELLFAGSKSNTTETNIVNKNSNLAYMPSYGYLELNGRFQANSLRSEGFSTYMSQGVACIYLRGDGTKDSVVIQATSDGGKICLSDDIAYSDNIVLTGDDGNIDAISLNGVVIGNSPKFTDTTYESKASASGGTAVSLCTTGEKYTWNNKANISTPAQDTLYYTTATSLSYTTKSITCPSGHTYIVRAKFQWVNAKPYECAASSVSSGWNTNHYYDYKNISGAMELHFILKSGETAYYLASCEAASKTNIILQDIIDIT